jgi:hypothetical protein
LTVSAQLGKHTMLAAGNSWADHTTVSFDTIMDIWCHVTCHSTGSKINLPPSPASSLPLVQVAGSAHSPLVHVPDLQSPPLLHSILPPQGKQAPPPQFQSAGAHHSRCAHGHVLANMPCNTTIELHMPCRAIRHDTRRLATTAGELESCLIESDTPIADLSCVLRCVANTVVLS